MKIIETKYHGELEVNSEEIFTFPKGIPAFEEYKDFIFKQYDLESPFYILQSIEDKEIAFVTVDIFLFFQDYDYEIPKSVVELLKINRHEDVKTLGIVTVMEPFENSTINLYAPVVLNLNTRRGKQIFLEGSQYKVKTPILSASLV